jgi:hypothetical protein
MGTKDHKLLAGKTHPFIAILSSVGFPLTLTLSLGKRGQRVAAARFFAFVNRPCPVSLGNTPN